MIIKKIATVLLVTAFSLTAFGQTETEIIKKANDLIANKKYESAFELLQKFDPKNGEPDIVLLKEDIALNYFVTSLMHQTFAFKDLEKNEDIMDYRGKAGSFSMYMFPINDILDSLIKIYPNNYKLYKGLGDFYYDAHLRYGDNWLKNDSELFELIEANYTKAIENEVGDYFSYYVLGYIKISKGNYKEGIPYFLKSIELNKDYPTSHYNLAYAYLYIDDRENALKYAKQSLDLYQDSVYKGDAARLVAIIYTELKDEKKAIEYCEMSNLIDPYNYHTLRVLLSLYVKTGNPKAKETLNLFFNLEPTNPTTYNDLSDIYLENGKADDLAVFYKSKLDDFKDDKQISGNLNFYLGQIYMDRDKKAAKEYFLKANQIFGTFYEKDHQVFKAIEEALKQLE